MKKITSALALVGALGLFAACGDAVDSGTAPEGPAVDTTETVDADTPDADAVVDADGDAAPAGDMDPAALQTVQLEIAGMT